MRHGIWYYLSARMTLIILEKMMIHSKQKRNASIPIAEQEEGTKRFIGMGM